MKFLALNADFSSQSRYSLGGLHKRESKTALPPKKVVILPLLARLVGKQLQIDTDMLRVITSASDELFNGVNIDDLE